MTHHTRGHYKDRQSSKGTGLESHWLDRTGAGVGGVRGGEGGREDIIGSKWTHHIGGHYKDGQRGSGTAQQSGAGAEVGKNGLASEQTSHAGGHYKDRQRVQGDSPNKATVTQQDWGRSREEPTSTWANESHWRSLQGQAEGAVVQPQWSHCHSTGLGRGGGRGGQTRT